MSTFFFRFRAVPCVVITWSLLYQRKVIFITNGSAFCTRKHFGKRFTPCGAFDFFAIIFVFPSAFWNTSFNKSSDSKIGLIANATLRRWYPTCRMGFVVKWWNTRMMWNTFTFCCGFRNTFYISWCGPTRKFVRRFRSSYYNIKNFWNFIFSRRTFAAYFSKRLSWAKSRNEFIFLLWRTWLPARFFIDTK